MIERRISADSQEPRDIFGLRIERRKMARFRAGMLGFTIGMLTASAVYIAGNAPIVAFIVRWRCSP